MHPAFVRSQRGGAASGRRPTGHQRGGDPRRACSRDRPRPRDRAYAVRSGAGPCARLSAPNGLPWSATTSSRWAWVMPAGRSHRKIAPPRKPRCEGAARATSSRLDEAGPLGAVEHPDSARTPSPVRMATLTDLSAAPPRYRFRPCWPPADTAARASRWTRVVGASQRDRRGVADRLELDRGSGSAQLSAGMLDGRKRRSGRCRTSSTPSSRSRAIRFGTRTTIGAAGSWRLCKDTPSAWRGMAKWE